jgi:malonate-semialdehyde dehydrogenase (acetylating)/methylmalonate-semialdehyde dehydrogenase
VGVSFVGSSDVAKVVYQRASATGKRVQALGGAKNHLIILPDADPELTTRACMDSVFGSPGQRCRAGSFVVGVGEAFESMRERILDTASSWKMGDGLDPDTDMGPVVSAAHRDRINRFISEGEGDGLKPVLDGRGATVPGLEGGFWVGPTVFEDVPFDISIGTEEIFGPVANLNRAASLDEAIEAMRAGHFGNACSIFTTSGRAAREFRYRAEISMIGVNIGIAAPMAFFPFGGAKGSFFGDLKAQGRDAISFYTDARVVISRW